MYFTFAHVWKPVISSFLLLLLVIFAPSFPALATNPAGSSFPCKGWSIVPSPDISDQWASSLNAISALNEKNAWTIGNTTDGSAFAEHWNGTGWSIVPTPNPGGSANGGTNFSGIATLPDTAAWIVGSYYNAAGIRQTLTEYWNGKVWSIVPSPNVGDRSNELLAIAPIPGSHKAWAVGGEQDINGNTQTLFEYWNGTTWNVIPDGSYNPGEKHLISIVALSANNVWAVGSSTLPSLKTQALIEHWDGKTWSIVPNPDTSAYSSLHAVIDVPGSNQLWAVGTTAYYFPLILRYTNGSWNVVPGSNANVAYSYLNSLDGSSASNLLAVGLTFTEQWDGKSWKSIPNLSIHNLEQLSVAHIPHTNKYWVVGSYQAPTGMYHTLIESYC